MKHAILGITGGIAAYKAADIANELTKKGISVHVIMTKNAQRFITPLTLQTLTKNKVHTEMFCDYEPDKVEHITLAQQADIFVVAPATANFIAKASCGIADDMLTSVFLAFGGSKKPVLICPAMNTAMYENPATQENLGVLKGRGCFFVEPREALLACGDTGKGALADKEDIIDAVEKLL